MQLKPINQQVVAVVGASSGIGRESALQFAKRGAKLVVSARSESKLASLVDEIRGFGGEATAVVADVSVFEQVKAIADRTVERHGDRALGERLGDAFDDGAAGGAGLVLALIAIGKCQGNHQWVSWLTPANKAGKRGPTGVGFRASQPP